MRDEEIAQVQVLLQLREQGEYLGLDGHVQGRNGLVQHHHLRLQHQGACNRHALALAARERMRTPFEYGGRQAHALEHVMHALAAFLGRQRLEVEQRLLNDVEDTLARIQRAERVLVDQLDLAPQLAQGLAAQAREFGAGDADASRCRACQAHDVAYGRGLARARLADDGMRGAPAQA